MRRLTGTLLAILLGVASTGRAEWYEQSGKRFRILSDSAEAGVVLAELEAFADTLESRSAELQLRPTAPFEIVAVASPDLWEALTAHHAAAHRASGLHLSRADASWLLLDLGPERAPEALRTARHELAHHVMALNLPPLPLALAEGLAEYYAATGTGDEPHFGSTIAAWQRQLIGPRDLDLEALLSIEAEDAGYTERDRAAWFYARSWGLVHWLLEGEATPRDAAANLIAALAAGTPAAAALEQATGLAPEIVEQRLRAHVASLPAPRGQGQRQSSKSAPRVVDPPTAKRRLAGLAALLGARRLALDFAQQSWIAAPESADSAAALAEVLAAEARIDEADRLWQDAWNGGLTDPRLLVGFARRRFEQQDFSRARGALRRALEHHPRYAEALALLVRCDLADRSVDASTLSSARSARRLLPFRADLIQLEAAVLAIRGEAGEAQRLLEHELAALAPDLVAATTRRVQQQAHIHRGFDSWRLGNLDAARRAWDEALVLTDDADEHEGLRRQLLLLETALSALENADP